MTLHTWYDATGRLVREWHCCGLLWQLLLTRHFPARQTWRPRCPRCHHPERTS